mgnify:FL=1
MRKLLSIDLIDTINPFQHAFEILSKSVTTKTLKVIQDAIESTRIQLSEEQAVYYYKKAVEYKKKTGKNPDINSLDPLEKKMAESIIFLQNLRRKQGV